MSSFATRRSAALQHYPLVAHDRPDAITGYRHAIAVSAAAFLHDVERTAAALPASGHVLNFCTDRYRFAVLLCAAVTRRQMTLLPPTATPNVMAAMRAFAPDAYFASDDPAIHADLPRCKLPELDGSGAGRFLVPSIPADQVAACVFTSGSTGEPQPHFKTWGSLAIDVAEGAARLGIGPGHAILGTVPPQHMYGFESTVMLPLLSGAALTSQRPYYPADIDAAIEALAPKRILFTTPFHLRAWLNGAGVARIEKIVSATAPLSVALAREAEEKTGAQMLEIYGCTEAGQVATRRPTQSVEWEALDGLRLWNDAGQAMVFGGHVETPTALQDVIEVRGDGTRFLLHGRLADMVNIAGKRNSLGYLNHQLAAIPGVVDGIFFLPDEAPEGHVARLTAFVVAPGLKAADVMKGLRSRIDAAFLPRPLLMVDALPRELTGKLPHASLRALASKSRKRSRGGDA